MQLDAVKSPTLYTTHRRSPSRQLMWGPLSRSALLRSETDLLASQERQELLPDLPTSPSYKEPRGLMGHLLAGSSSSAHVSTCAGGHTADVAR